jgi:hypothetical protein
VDLRAQLAAAPAAPVASVAPVPIPTTAIAAAIAAPVPASVAIAVPTPGFVGHGADVLPGLVHLDRRLLGEPGGLCGGPVSPLTAQNEERQDQQPDAQPTRNTCDAHGSLLQEMELFESMHETI